MQIANRSIDDTGVTQISDPTEAEKEGLIDNLWFAKRDESTLDEKTHDPKLTKELAALFKKTEAIKQNRTDAMVFPVAARAIDAQKDLMSPTMALLIARALDIASKNAEKPHLTNQSWHKALNEPLKEVAERHNIPFPIFLYNISVLVTHVCTRGRELGPTPSNALLGGHGIYESVKIKQSPEQIAVHLRKVKSELEQRVNDRPFQGTLRRNCTRPVRGTMSPLSELTKTETGLEETASI